MASRQCVREGTQWIMDNETPPDTILTQGKYEGLIAIVFRHWQWRNECAQKSSVGLCIHSAWHSLAFQLLYEATAPFGITPPALQSWRIKCRLCFGLCRWRNKLIIRSAFSQSLLHSKATWLGKCVSGARDAKKLMSKTNTGCFQESGGGDSWVCDLPFARSDSCLHRGRLKRNTPLSHACYCLDANSHSCKGTAFDPQAKLEEYRKSYRETHQWSF